MSPIHSLRPLRYPTIWISHLDLDSKACKTEVVLDVIKSGKSEFLYLEGDVVARADAGDLAVSESQSPPTPGIRKPTAWSAA